MLIIHFMLSGDRILVVVQLFVFLNLSFSCPLVTCIEKKWMPQSVSLLNAICLLQLNTSHTSLPTLETRPVNPPKPRVTDVMCAVRISMAHSPSPCTWRVRRTRKNWRLRKGRGGLKEGAVMNVIEMRL